MPETASLLLHLRPFDEAKKGYPVEAELDDGSRFSGGVLRLDQERLLELLLDAEGYGLELFDSLFIKDIRRAYDKAMGRAEAQFEGRLRVRLWLDEDAAELHALPWERLYHLLKGQYVPLSTSVLTPLSRYTSLEIAEPTPLTSTPLKVLVVISNPSNLPSGLAPINYEQEIETLRQAFNPLKADKKVSVSVLPGLSGLPAALKTQVEADGWKVLEGATTLENMVRHVPDHHILHFIGHGGFRRRDERGSGQAALHLEKDDGTSIAIRDNDIVARLTAIDPAPRLIFLVACESAKREAEHPLIGLAPKLVQAGIPAVVAMQAQVPVVLARKLAGEFYWRLLEHGEVDRALNQARLVVFDAKSTDWAIPVLFMRLKEGVLIGQEPAKLTVPPPPPPAPPPDVAGFVGREVELAHYAEMLKTKHLAILTGMAGMGKTALAAALVKRAIQVGLVPPNKVFWHSFHADEGMASIIWKIAGFLFWQDQPELWTILQTTQQSGSQPPPPEVLFDYIVQALRGQQVWVCLDDVQFVEADPLLAKGLGRLQPLITAGEMALIITSQRKPSIEGAEDFDPVPGLRPVDVRDLFQLRGLEVPEAVVAQINNVTGGNALFITLAADMLRRGKDPNKLLQNLVEVESVERYLVKEVDNGLTDPERVVMKAVAALLGYPSPREAIETALAGENVRRVLLSLIERYFLTVTEQDDSKRYDQNSVVRAFFYEQLSKSERQTMHQRLGEYYATNEPDVLRAALHFYQADEYERAASLVTTDTQRLINEGQARFLRQTLERFTERQLEKPIWLAVQLARGEVYLVLGELDLARQSYELAHSLAVALPDETQMRELRARACRGVGEVLQEHEPQVALEWLKRGLAELTPATNKGDKAQKRVGQALAALEEPPPDAKKRVGRALAALEKAYSATQPLTIYGAAANVIEAGALHIRIGRILGYLKKPAEAIQELQAGLALLPTQPSRFHFTALNNLGLIYNGLGDPERCLEYYQQAIQVATQLRDDWALVGVWINLGNQLLALGRWTEAITNYQRALEKAEHLGSHGRINLILLNLGVTYLCLGKYQAAEDSFGKCLATAREKKLTAHLIYAGLGLADLYVRQAQPERALPLLAEVESLSQAIQFKGALSNLHGVWALAHLAQGRFAEALTSAENSLALAREFEAKVEEGTSLRILGQVQVAQKQLEAALTAFEQSLALLTDRDPYEAARTQKAWGQALVAHSGAYGVAHGQTERGETLLAAARATFERLGAQSDLTT